jgi:hypothetical protein
LPEKHQKEGDHLAFFSYRMGIHAIAGDLFGRCPESDSLENLRAGSENEELSTGQDIPAVPAVF